MPYAVHAMLGALVGLALALLVAAVLRALRQPRAVPDARRRVRPPSTGRTRHGSPGTGSSTAAADLGRPKTVPSAAPALTKPELSDMRLKVRRSVLNAMREMNGGGDRDDILARARSIGGFTTRELTAPPPLRQRHRHPTQIDHDLSWALTDLKRDGLATNPARGIWRLTDAAAPEPESPLSEDIPPSRLSELQAMPYDEYLRTPEWRHARAAALVRADHECALDPRHRGPMEVHHRSYERRGAELPSDLVVLCRSCHRRHHREN